MDKKILVFALILLALLPAVALASSDIATTQEQNQDSFSKTDNNTEERLPWGLILTSIIAGAAVVTIYLSGRAVTATRKATQGELITQIGDIYGSPEMLEAMMRLIGWVEEKEEKKEDWLKTFRELRSKRARYSEIEQVDKDRRKFLCYYAAIDVLKDQGLLSEKIVKSLRSEGQELFYKMVVMPLNDQIKPKITKEWPKRTVNYQRRNSNP